jgi:ABC-type nitrate/sulfonate/bicarbonate transport system substrate-binding protein
VRKNGGNPKDLKVLQLGGDPNRLAALKIGTVQYTFLGASATEQAKSLGFKVLATAKQLGIPFPWTSVVVHEAWLDRNRDLAYRYVKSLTEAVWFMKRYRGESERIIAKYLKLPPILAAAEYDFNIDTFPELPYPTIEGVSLILENLSPDNPDAARLNARDFVDSSIVDQIKREAFVNSLR